eukprot:5538977-Amphidinium_carterae.5
MDFAEEQVQQHEKVLQTEKIIELYIILPQKALDMWLTLGKLPGSYIENGTEEKHSWYNFHKEIQCAMNDFINLYLYNFPLNYKASAHQLTEQDFFLTVVHTTERLLEVLQQDLKETQGRGAHWYTRKNLDVQFQIQGERLGRENPNTMITIGKYM